MTNTIKIVALGVITLCAMFAANFARDLSYQTHAIIVMLVAGGLFLVNVRRIGEPKIATATGYMDDVVRFGVVATTFWGVVGFLAGTYIAFQLAFPALNIEWAEGYTNFGRLRPLHTSAVILRLAETL